MICPITDRECRTNGCGTKCYKKDSLGQANYNIKPCDNCEPISGFYLGTSCPKCNRPFRSVHTGGER